MKTKNLIIGFLSLCLSVGMLNAADKTADDHYQSGMASSKSGDTTAAMESYKAAIALDGSVADYHAQLGACYMNKAGEASQSGDMMGAGTFSMHGMDLAKKAVAMDPKNITAHTSLWGFYAHAPEFVGGSVVKAEEHANLIKEIDEFQGMIFLALTSVAKSNHPQAIERISNCLKMQPTSEWALTELSKVYIAMGDTAKVKETCEKLIAAHPDNTFAKEQLAM